MRLYVQKQRTFRQIIIKNATTDYQQHDTTDPDGADEVSDSDNRSWQSSESGEKESDIESSDEEYASSSDDAGEEE